MLAGSSAYAGCEIGGWTASLEDKPWRAKASYLVRRRLPDPFWLDTFQEQGHGIGFAYDRCSNWAPYPELDPTLNLLIAFGGTNPRIGACGRPIGRRLNEIQSDYRQ